MISEPVDWPIPEVQNDGWGAGFGTVLAAGVGKVWFSNSYSFTWTNTTATDEPVFAFNTGFRVGMQVYSRNRKHSGSIWIGANYLNYSGTNTGSYLINQIIPEDKPRLEDLKDQLEDMREGLNDRYNDWCTQPGNGPKCTILDPMIEEIVNQIEDKLSDIEPPDVYIDYLFDKEPAQKWNMLVGTQYHYSKHWEFRVEVGFWNEKFTTSANVNYRFGFWHRKK